MPRSSTPRSPTPKAPPKIPALKALARGGYGATVRAGRYPDDYADASKRGTEIQFRLKLVTREAPPAPGAIPERVQHCYERLLTMRDRLVAARRGLEAEQLMRDAALHVDEPELFEAALSVAEMVTTLPAATERSEWTTWGDVAEAWTSGALARRFPSKQIKDKASKKKDEGIIAWLKPFIGNVPLETFNHEHYDRAMGNLPAGVKADTAKRHYATVVMRVMRLARKCRLVTAWHLDDVEPWKCEKKDRKVFTCLFPRDVGALLSCPELEYRWRVFWGFMIFESPRIGYLSTVKWRHVETDGTGGIGMESKSGEWLSWDLRPGTLEALLRMRELYPELEGPFAWLTPAQVERAAETLREHLAIAGVLDERIHANDGRRRRMRAHDLRATFVVFAKIEGRDLQWIMDRTGHTSTEMVQRYDRMERKARGKGWQALGRLDEALAVAVGPDAAPELVAGDAPRALLTEGQAVEGDELAGGEEMSDDEVDEAVAYCERVRGEVLARAAADRREGGRGVVLDVPGHTVRVEELGPDERVGGPSSDAGEPSPLPVGAIDESVRCEDCDGPLVVFQHIAAGDGRRADTLYQCPRCRDLTLEVPGPGGAIDTEGEESPGGGDDRGPDDRGPDDRGPGEQRAAGRPSGSDGGLQRGSANDAPAARPVGSDGKPIGSDGNFGPVGGARTVMRSSPGEQLSNTVATPTGAAPDGCGDEGNTHTVTDTVTKAVTVSYPKRGIRRGKRGHMRGKTASYETVPAPGFEPESRDSKTRDRRPEPAESRQNEARDAREATGNDSPSRAPVTASEASRPPPVTPRAAYAAALKRAMVAAIEAEALDDLSDLTRLFEGAKSAAGGAKVVELALRRTGG